MATSFLTALRDRFPESAIDVIISKGIEGLKNFMPYVNHFYLFSKATYPGLIGNYKFGREMARQKSYDFYFCLPFSFSSALTGFFARCTRRIGHRTEHRGFLFTDRYRLPDGLHVVEDYMNLLDNFFGEKVTFRPPKLTFGEPVNFKLPEGDYIVLNACSGPPSRFIPAEKSASIIVEVKRKYTCRIVLTGGPNEVEYIGLIENSLKDEVKVINLAGKTSITELGWVLKNAKAMITTDSGNAHFANAVGTPTVVLFGAGLQSRCHPYNDDIFRPLQLLDLECVPCRSEHCKFGDNRCLSGIENIKIFEALDDLLR